MNRPVLVDRQRTAAPARSTSTDQTPADERADAVVADLLARESPEVLERVSVRLERMRAVHPLDRVMQAWDLSHADVAAMFSLSRQAIAKWLNIGVPKERVTAVADMAAATDLLQHHLKPDRISAVVRRPAAALGGRSLLDLATAGETAEVLAACRAMFQFGNVGT
jgi:hypothetical protein